MIDYDNTTDFPLDTELLERIVTHLDAGDIELVVTDDDTIRTLNREHRGIDKPTDVLSFPYEPMPMAPIGSVVVSVDRVKAAAQAYGHTDMQEFALLFIHGMLHLLGYDHETDDGEMRAEEARLIALFDLPSSLIVRTEKEG